MSRLYPALGLSAATFLLTVMAALPRPALASADSTLVISPGGGKVKPGGGGPLELEDEIVIEGRKVPILEVVRRAQEGERHKYDGLTTLAYTQKIRLTMKYGGRKARTRVQEIVQRVYYRAPDDWVTATIQDTTVVVSSSGEVRRDTDEDDEGQGSVRITVTNDGASIGDVPIYLERLDKFRFTALRRSVTDSTALHEIRFEPMSDFGTLPGGRIWLLAPTYQIVREEYELERLPYPWIFKKLDFLVREWQPVEGRWVQKRIAARARLGMNFLSVPEAVEFAMDFTDYRFNPVLDEAIFTGRKR